MLVLTTCQTHECFRYSYQRLPTEISYHYPVLWPSSITSTLNGPPQMPGLRYAYHIWPFSRSKDNYLTWLVIRYFCQGLFPSNGAVCSLQKMHFEGISAIMLQMDDLATKRGTFAYFDPKWKVPKTFFAAMAKPAA